MAQTPPEKSYVSCAYETCYTVDFLPLKCQWCGGLFCKEHSSIDGHGCLAAAAADGTVEERKGDAKSEDIVRKTLRDREMEYETKLSHSVRSSERERAEQERKAKAREILLKNYGAQGQSFLDRQASGVGVKKVANAINPMVKLRREAKALRDSEKSVPDVERFYIYIRHQNADKAFWTKKSTSVGKTLDLVCGKLGIMDPTKYYLMNSKGSETPLEINKTLASSLNQGDVVVLQAK